MSDVTDASAERAASAVINTGRHWEEVKNAVRALQTCKLTPNTVLALLADELDISNDETRYLLDALKQSPNNLYRVIAA